MYTTLLSLHRVDPDRFREVRTAMLTLGAPTIRVVDCGDHYVALEGTHRLAACADLGIAPQLVILDQEDLVEAHSLDWEDLSPDEQYTAGELAGEAYSYSNGCYTLHEDGTLEAC